VVKLVFIFPCTVCLIVDSAHTVYWQPLLCSDWLSFLALNNSSLIFCCHCIDLDVHSHRPMRCRAAPQCNAMHTQRVRRAVRRNAKHRILQCDWTLTSSVSTASIDVARAMQAQAVIVLSHWPHVAAQVAQLVASVKGLGHKLPNLLLNLCGNMWPV